MDGSYEDDLSEAVAYLRHNATPTMLGEYLRGVIEVIVYATRTPEKDMDSELHAVLDAILA